MTIIPRLIRSRIATRFFLLFFFCALIPTLALFTVSFIRVTKQLSDQNDIKIIQEAKAYGLSLYDRLLRLDNTLRNLAVMISFESKNRIQSNLYVQESTKHIFKAIEKYSPQGEREPLFGIITSAELKSVMQKFKGDKQTQIICLHNSNRIDSLYLIFPKFLNGKVQFFLIGKVNPVYLWGVGSEYLLPIQTELSVYNDHGLRIIGAFHSPGRNLEKTIKTTVSSNSRIFSYEIDGKKYLAGTWVLFVRANFANAPWTIVLSQSKESAFSSINNFKSMFFQITLLALMLTLFLSLVFIRRTLNPLQQLEEGTKEIAKKNFSLALDIKSGDEFEDLGKSFNSMTTQLRKQFEALTTIDKIDRAILSSFDLNEIIDNSLKMLKEFFGVDLIILGRLMTLNGLEMKIYRLDKGREIASDYIGLTERERDLIFADMQYTVLSKRQSPAFLQIIDPVDCPQFVYLPLVVERKFQSMLILGYACEHEYNDEELKQARQLADQVTIALSKAKLVTELEDLIIGTIEALARTVDAKSKWTAGHSERVADLAGRIGMQMGFSKQQINLLKRGGLLHDIGKIGIPISILDKSGKLNETEMNEIKRHPYIGARILEHIEAYKTIIPLIAQHHEHFDGTGYPAGLSGNQIDPLARTLIVADVFDALVSDRPYRDGWLPKDALNYIIEGSGSHFDPKVVEAFLKVAY